MAADPHPTNIDLVRRDLRRLLGLSTSETPGPEGSAEPTTGDLIGGHEIVDEIGRGGMGIVFKARHVELDRIVALKVSLFDPQTRPDAIERFLREARAAASVRDRNVVAVHDVGRDGDLYYLSMDLVEGSSLADVLEDEGALDPLRAARIVRDAARGLAAAHRRGVLHRDLKPANVLVDGEGRGLLTDFGLARRKTVDKTLTESGVLLGTPAYMAPEQIAGDTSLLGPPCDVYGMGATLYEALTTRPPYESRDLMSLLNDIASRDPVPIRQRRPDVPRQLASIVETAMERLPTQRYPNASALADDLDRFLAGRSILGRPTPPLRRLALWSRRHPLAAALVLGTIVGGLVGGGWIVQSRAAVADRLEAADGALETGGWSEAIEGYEAVLAEDPGDHRARGGRRLAVEAAVASARASLETGRHEEARLVLEELRRSVADPGPDERRWIDGLEREIAAEERSMAPAESLIASLRAGADSLAEAIGLLRAAVAEIEDRPDQLAARREDLLAIARDLTRWALVDRDGPARARLAEVVERISGGAVDPWTADASSVRVTARSGGREVEAEVFTLPLPDDGWRSRLETDLLRVLSGPPARRPVRLAPGRHLLVLRSAGRPTCRFELVVEPRTLVGVAVDLPPRLEVDLDLVPVVAPVVRIADAIDPLAPADSSRARHLARLVEAYAALAAEGPALVSRCELSEAEFARLYPEPPAAGWAPHGWSIDYSGDRPRWRRPPGTEDLPLRGVTLAQARQIAATANRRLLDRSAAGDWRIGLPTSATHASLRFRLFGGTERAGLVAPPDPLDLLLTRRQPAVAEPNQVVRPVGSDPGDISLHGLADLEGNVAEWTTGEIPVAVMGGSFDNSLIVTVPDRDEPRPSIGLRLVVAPGPRDGLALDVPDDPVLASDRAIGLFRVGDPTTGRGPDALAAQEFIEAHLARHPDEALGRLNAALFALAQRNRIRARLHLDHVLDRPLGTPGERLAARLLRVWVLFWIERVEGTADAVPVARGDLDALLEAHPGNQALLLGRAYFLFLEDRLAEALADIEALLPGFLRLAHLQRWFDAGELDGDQQVLVDQFLAMAEVPRLDHVLDADGDFLRRTVPSGKQHNRGMVGRVDRAMASLPDLIAGLRREGEEEATTFARVARQIATLYTFLGDPDQGRRLVPLFKAVPAEAHLGLADLDLLEGHDEAAAAGYRKVLATDPDHPGAAAGLAWALLGTDEATAAIARAAASGTPDAPILAALEALGAGRLDEAGRALAAAAADDAAARILTGEIERRSNRPDAARQAWRAAGAIDPSYRPLIRKLEARIAGR